MLKNISRLEHKIGDRAYHFLCDHDSPLNEVKDALLQYLKYVVDVENAIKAKQEAENARSQNIEESKEAVNS